MTHRQFMGKQGESTTEALVTRLQRAVGSHTPHLWRSSLCGEEASALAELCAAGRTLTLGDLIRDPSDLSGTLECVPLVLVRGSERVMLPGPGERVQRNDEILFCGTERSERLLCATLNNPYTLDCLMTGSESPRGYFFQWLARRRPTA